MARTLLVALLLAATYGCSNDGGSADNTLPGTDAPATSTSTSLSRSTPTAATSIPASTTVATPTTEPVITSADPTTSQDTAPIETTPSSTDPPLDVTPPERDQLIVAMQRWNDASRACLRDPVTCDAVAVAAASNGALQASLLRFVQERVALGVKSVPSERPTYYVVLDVAVAEDRQTGSVTICNVNGDVAVRINDPSTTEDDEVVDESLVSSRSTLVFELVEGDWKAASAEQLEVVRGENSCPPPAQ